MNNQRSDKAGMTLLEVMIAMYFVSIAIAAIYLGVLQGNRANYTSSQYACALGLCMEKIEEMRGDTYTDLTNGTYYIGEHLNLTRLGGKPNIQVRLHTIKCHNTTWFPLAAGRVCGQHCLMGFPI